MAAPISRPSGLGEVSGPVEVLEIPTASKVDALNAGDRACSAFPRFYVDADVLLTLESVRRIADVLEGGPLLAAAPDLHVDLRSSTPLVRSYYRIWCRLQSVESDLVGRGVYAISAPGRERFGTFPDLVADDHFVRSVFRSVGIWADFMSPIPLSPLASRFRILQLLQPFPPLHLFNP